MTEKPTYLARINHLASQRGFRLVKYGKTGCIKLSNVRSVMVCIGYASPTGAAIISGLVVEIVYIFAYFAVEGRLGSVAFSSFPIPLPYCYRTLTPYGFVFGSSGSRHGLV